MKRLAEILQRYYVTIIIAIVLFLTLIKRISILDPHLLNWDEVVYVTQAIEMVEKGVYMEFEPYRPPLWPLFLGIVFSIVGYSPVVIEMISWLMGALMLFSFVYLYRSMFNRDIANLAILITVSVPGIWLFLGARVMSESLFIIAGNLLWAIMLPKLMKGDSPLEYDFKDGLAIGLLLGFATLAKYTSFLLLIPPILLMIARKKFPKPNIGWISTIITFVPIVSILFILSALNTGTPLGFWIQYQEANALTSYGPSSMFDPVLMFGMVIGYLLVLATPFALLSFLKGAIELDKDSFIYTIWFLLPLVIQALLRPDIFYPVFLDLGSGGLFVRLTLPWISGGVILAALWIMRYKDKRKLFVLLVTATILVNCSFAGYVTMEYRSSTSYQQLGETKIAVDELWDDSSPILTNWLTFMYPYGRDTVVFIPEDQLEYQNLVDQGVQLIIQHTGNFSLGLWWNPEADNFTLAFKSELGLFLIWSKI